jgi:hypothetical protein
MMGLRKRMTIACSRSGMTRRCTLRPGSRQRCVLRPGTRKRHALGPGSRMASGGSMTMSRVTEEQEHLTVLKNC